MFRYSLAVKNIIPGKLYENQKQVLSTAACLYEVLNDFGICIWFICIINVKYKKRLLPRCIHHFKSDLINNMDHMRISGTVFPSFSSCDVYTNTYIFHFSHHAAAVLYTTYIFHFSHHAAAVLYTTYIFHFSHHAAAALYTTYIFHFSHHAAAALYTTYIFHFSHHAAAVLYTTYIFPSSCSSVFFIHSQTVFRDWDTNI